MNIVILDDYRHQWILLCSLQSNTKTYTGIQKTAAPTTTSRISGKPVALACAALRILKFHNFRV